MADLMTSFATFGGGILMLMVSILFYIIIGLLIVVMLGGGWYFLIYRKRLYNCDCIILVKRAGTNPIIGFDKGGFITKKKLSRFNLSTRKKVRIDPPKYEQIYMNERGRNTLFLYKYGEQDYTPLDLSLAQDVLILKPIIGASKDAVVQDMRELIMDLKNPSFLEKFGMPIIFLGGILIVLAAIYFVTALLMKSMSTLSGNLVEISKNTAQTAVNKTGIIFGTI